MCMDRFVQDFYKPGPDVFSGRSSIFKAFSTSAIMVGIFDFFGAGGKFIPFDSRDF